MIVMTEEQSKEIREAFKRGSGLGSVGAGIGMFAWTLVAILTLICLLVLVLCR